MRILFFESNWANVNGIPNGFRDLGHEVLVSGPLTEGRILLLIDEFRPDFILTMGWGPEQKVRTQKWIRKYVQLFNLPLIYWATEDPHFTETFTMPLIGRMQPDFVFTLTPELVNFYESLGIGSASMDFGYHPSFHYPSKSLDEFQCDIAVVANAYPDVLRNSPEHYRHHSLKTLIAPLLKENIRIDIWGKSWDKMSSLGYDIPSHWLHGFLPYEETGKVYNSAKMIIGLQNYQTQVTRRTREILASGGFLLTSDTPAIRRLFKPGKNLAVSSSPEETLRLVKHYLYQKPMETEKVRKKAPKAVTKDTYTHRAKYMLDILGESGLLRAKKANYSRIPHFKVHRVSRGDTLSLIAEKYGVSVKKIRKQNDLRTDIIHPGLELILIK